MNDYEDGMVDPTKPGVTPPPDPYGPRSRAHLKGYIDGLEGADLSLPTEQEILDAQGDPEAIEALRARAVAAQAKYDKASDRNYVSDSGAFLVANPWQAVADMFIRGGAKKDRDDADKSASEIAREARAAEAKLTSRNIARDRADYVNQQLQALDEADRKDAQDAQKEKTRVTERGEDRSTLTLRDQIDKSYRDAQIRLAQQELDDKRDERKLGPQPTYKDLADEREKGTAIQKNYDTWRVASGQYLDAHKQGNWGGAAAASPGNRMRESSKANLAPVLKGLFRSAGEGTFTDKDQELLLEMAPTKWDTDKVAEEKLRNIDNIVRAKLGLGDGGRGTKTTGASGSWEVVQ